jgi:hypothetical protein
VRFVAANLHPDHDTVAVFWNSNKTAFKSAFLQILLLARESGLLRLGTVSIDSTKIDANASKIRSVRYDRAKELRIKLADDIAALTAQTEAADTQDSDPQALPAEIARRESLKAKLDTACKRLEAEARADAETARPAYEAKHAVYDAKRGRRGRPPKPPDDQPPPERQSNLTDPDSALMRRSDGHEYRQAYNAQAERHGMARSPRVALEPGAGVAMKAQLRSVIERVFRRLPGSRVAYSQRDAMQVRLDAAEANARADEQCCWRSRAAMPAAPAHDPRQLETQVPVICILEERTLIATRCRDADVLPKVANAGPAGAVPNRGVGHGRAALRQRGVAAGRTRHRAAGPAALRRPLLRAKATRSLFGMPKRTVALSPSRPVVLVNSRRWVPEQNDKEKPRRDIAAGSSL